MDQFIKDNKSNFKFENLQFLNKLKNKYNYMQIETKLLSELLEQK